MVFLSCSLSVFAGAGAATVPPAPREDGNRIAWWRMPRNTLEREIARLQGEILAMGNRVECALLQSVKVLRAGDREGARALIAADQQVSAQRYAIEADCLALLATQQPMAGTCARSRRCWRSLPSWSECATMPRELQKSL